MTELNDYPEAGAELHAADWPAGITRTGEDAVDGVLALLEDLPGHPVEGHSSVYTSLHDALLEALNAEPGSAASAIASAPDRRDAGAGGA